MPVNEAAPKFSNNPSITVSENKIVLDAVIYTATDTDYSPHGVVLYKIQSGMFMTAIYKWQHTSRGQKVSDFSDDVLSRWGEG